MIKILICEPHKAPRVATIADTLKAEQEVVGGFIEVTCPPSHGGDNTVIICNEEGKLGGYEINRAITLLDGTPYDVIYGTFFIAGMDEEGDNIDLTDEQIRKYSAMYQKPLPDDYAETHADICEPHMEFVPFSNLPWWDTDR